MNNIGSFSIYLERVERFIIKYGRTPNIYNSLLERSLHSWIVRVKHQYNNKKLSSEKLSLLLKNDMIREYFIVGVRKRNWIYTMSNMSKYIEEKKALPLKSSSTKVRILHFWLVNTKARYMKGTLDSESVQLLMGEPLIKEFLKNKRKRRVLPFNIKPDY